MGGGGSHIKTTLEISGGLQPPNPLMISAPDRDQTFPPQTHPKHVGHIPSSLVLIQMCHFYVASIWYLHILIVQQYYVTLIVMYFTLKKTSALQWRITEMTQKSVISAHWHLDIVMCLVYWIPFLNTFPGAAHPLPKGWGPLDVLFFKKILWVSRFFKKKVAKNAFFFDSWYLKDI